jgi:hypothetical protein
MNGILRECASFADHCRTKVRDRHASAFSQPASRTGMTRPSVRR